MACHIAKINRHPCAEIGELPDPDDRFSHIYIEIVGLLPRSDGHTYLLTCVYRFNCCPKAFPITNITVETIAQTFLSGWTPRFDVPCVITTDRGWQFESLLFKELTNMLCGKRIRTTANHPEAKGLIERFNCTLKIAMSAILDDNHWETHLPLELQSAVKTYLKLVVKIS